MLGLLYLQGMELELKKLEEAVGSIHNEMLYLRERYSNVVALGYKWSVSFVCAGYNIFRNEFTAVL